MKNILSICSVPEERRAIFFSLIGPLFLLSTLFLASFVSPFPNADLWIITLFGLLLLLLFQKKGFSYAIGILVISLLFKHLTFSHHHLLQMGVESSIALGLFISLFSFESAADITKTIFHEKELLVKKRDEVKEELAKEEEFYLRQKKGFQDLIAELEEKLEKNSLLVEEERAEVEKYQKAYHSIVEEKESLVKELKNQKITHFAMKEDLLKSEKKIESYQDSLSLFAENRKLLDQLNEVRRQKMQSHLTNERLLSLLLQKEEELDPLEAPLAISESASTASADIAPPTQVEAEKQQETSSEYVFPEGWKEEIALKEQEITRLKEQLKKKAEKENFYSEENRDKMEKLYQNYHLYKQLKKQYEKRNETLHETRKELYQLKEKLLSDEKEKEIEKFDENPCEKSLCKTAQFLQNELSSLEEENQILEEIVSSMTFC